MANELVNNTDIELMNQTLSKLSKDREEIDKMVSEINKEIIEVQTEINRVEEIADSIGLSIAGIGGNLILNGYKNGNSRMKSAGFLAAAIGIGVSLFSSWSTAQQRKKLEEEIRKSNELILEHKKSFATERLTKITKAYKSFTDTILQTSQDIFWKNASILVDITSKDDMQNKLEKYNTFKEKFLLIPYSQQYNYESAISFLKAWKNGSGDNVIHFCTKQDIINRLDTFWYTNSLGMYLNGNLVPVYLVNILTKEKNLSINSNILCCPDRGGNKEYKDGFNWLGLDYTFYNSDEKIWERVSNEVKENLLEKNKLYKHLYKENKFFDKLRSDHFVLFKNKQIQFYPDKFKEVISCYNS